MTLGNVHAESFHAELRRLSKPGVSVVIPGQCGLCDAIIQCDDVLPSARLSERIDQVQVVRQAQHWSECDTLRLCRWARVDPESREWHDRNCWLACKNAPPVRWFLPAESGSGQPVVEIVDGRRTLASLVVRQRGQRGGSS